MLRCNNELTWELNRYGGTTTATTTTHFKSFLSYEVFKSHHHFVYCYFTLTAARTLIILTILAHLCLLLIISHSK